MTAFLPPRPAIDGHPIRARRQYLAAIQFAFPGFYRRLMAQLWKYLLDLRKETTRLYDAAAFEQMLVGFFDEHGITEGWLQTACVQTIGRWFDAMSPALSAGVAVDEAPCLRDGEIWWEYAEGFEEAFRPKFKSRPSFHPAFSRPYLLHETYGEPPSELGSKDTAIRTFRSLSTQEYKKQKAAELANCGRHERKVLGNRLDEEFKQQQDLYVDRMRRAFLETMHMSRNAILAVLKRFGTDGNPMTDLQVQEYMKERFEECKTLGLEALVKGRTRLEALVNETPKKFVQ